MTILAGKFSKKFFCRIELYIGVEHQTHDFEHFLSKNCFSTPKKFGADLALYGRNWPNSADISLNHGEHLDISFSSQQLQFKLSHKHFEAFLNFSNSVPIWPYTAEIGRIRRISV